MPYLLVGETRGAKGALCDLVEAVDRELSPGTRRRLTPTALIRLAATVLHRRGVGSVVFDEAQHLVPEAILHLLHVGDAADALGHPVRIGRPGTPKLHQRLAETAQMGQRVATVVHVGRWARDEFKDAWHEWHPHLPRLRRAVGAGEWRRLGRDVLDAACGSWRRAAWILETANGFAVADGVYLRAEHLRASRDGLSGEA